MRIRHDVRNSNIVFEKLVRITGFPYIVLRMPRTDRNERSLEQWLAYWARPHKLADIEAALGVSHSTYYDRRKADDFPDAEELRRIAETFGFDPVDLMIEFDLVDPEGSGDKTPFATTRRRSGTATDTRAQKPATAKSAKRKTSGGMSVDPDTPPL